MTWEYLEVIILLMVQKIRRENHTHLEMYKNLVNNGINYQPQLVSLSDFWTINSTIPPTECHAWCALGGKFLRLKFEVFIPEVLKEDGFSNITCICSIYLRIIQHTPGTYPRPPTRSLWRDSFHFEVKGDSWGMLQGYVGVLLEYIYFHRGGDNRHASCGLFASCELRKVLQKLEVHEEILLTLAICTEGCFDIGSWQSNVW